MFSDIFDLEHFKKSLQADVHVVSSLPSTHHVSKQSIENQIPFNVSPMWILAIFLHQVILCMRRAVWRQARLVATLLDEFPNISTKEILPQGGELEFSRIMQKLHKYSIGNPDSRNKKIDIDVLADL